MGFPIITAEGVTVQPASGQVQFVTFTGNTVVTGVVSDKSGEVEVRFVEADAQGKAPKTPDEFLALTPRVILKFPHIASFERFLQTLQGSHGTIVRGAADLAAQKKNEPPGTTKRKLVGSGHQKRAEPAKPPESAH